MASLLEALTVGDLIEQLKQFDENTHVHFTYNYGDHWRTMVAPSVAFVEQGPIIHSDYHDMPRIAADDEEDEDSVQHVVVLSNTGIF